MANILKTELRNVRKDISSLSLKVKKCEALAYFNIPEHHSFLSYLDYANKYNLGVALSLLDGKDCNTLLGKAGHFTGMAYSYLEKGRKLLSDFTAQHPEYKGFASEVAGEITEIKTKIFKLIEKSDIEDEDPDSIQQVA